MTKRLNLSPLIKHFSRKNKQIANRLSGLTTSPAGTRLSKVQIKKIAQTLIEIGDELDRTDPALASEADQLLQELTKEAQSSMSDFTKEFETGFGDLVNKATDAVKDNIKERQDKLQGGSKLMSEDTGYGDSMDCGMPAMGEDGTILIIEEDKGSPCEMGDSNKLMEKTDEPMLEDEDTLEIEDEEPTLEDIEEPEQEYDETDLEDIKDQLSKMKWRIADKKRREALEEAIEHVEKAMSYYEASKRRRDKVHEIFDGAGLQLRLKDFG